jgi:HK97 family phage major capsid protein
MASLDSLQQQVHELVRKTEDTINGIQEELKKALDAQSEQITKHGGSLKATTDTIARLEKQLDDVGKSFKERLDLLEKKMGSLSTRDFAEVEDRGSFVEFFCKSDAYQEYRNQRFTGTSRTVEFPKEIVQRYQKGMERKAISDSSAAALRDRLSVERIMEIISMPMRAQRVRDLFTVIPTTASTVEYVRETLSTIPGTGGLTNNAATVAEGATKPESDLNFTSAEAVLRTIAHYCVVTRQLADDIPALIPYLEARLGQGIDYKEDQQLLYGSGVAPDITGLLTDPNLQNYRQAAGDNKIDAVRRSLTYVRLAELSPSAIIMHPSDWEDIELAKDSQERYLWININMAGEQRLFRVPVLDTTAINEGTWVTGAFDTGAFVYDRGDLQMRASDSHSDFFIKNKVVFLVEKRVALAIVRPQAFVEGTWTHS